MKKNNYSAIIDYCNANKLKFCVANDMEIDPAMDFNDLPFIDTETFEIPCCFMVEKAVIVNIPTPNEMTPEDTGESYGKYQYFVHGLTAISRPQYIAPDGFYIKLMCWCDWIGEDNKEDDDIQRQDLVFINACREAIEKVRKEHWYAGNLLDFRVTIEGDDDPTLEIFGIDNLKEMYNYIKGKGHFDCEIYCTSADKQYAFTTDHGVWLTKNDIKAY